MKKRGSASGGHSRGNSGEAADSMRYLVDMSPEAQHRPKHAANTWNIVGVVGGQPPAAAAAASPSSTVGAVSADPGYETLKDYNEQNYPAYETVKNGRGENESEPGYETVTGGKKHEDVAEPGYETVANRSNMSDAPEPGYETVKGGNRDSEPGYETLPARTDQLADPGYETVHSRQEDNVAEPGYEQVRSGSHRPPSDCDSNYEQLKFTEHPDPGYESVKSCYDTVADNNYERVGDFQMQHDSSNSPMYAEIKKPVKAQPVYAIVNKKKSPEEKLAMSMEIEGSDAPVDVVLPAESVVKTDNLVDTDQAEEYVDESAIPNLKYRRSIEEEAAILVNSVEESAINILSTREKTNGVSADETVVCNKELSVGGEEGGLAVLANSEGSDTSSDAVFSRQVQYEQPSTLPGLVSVIPDSFTNDAAPDEDPITNGHSDLAKTRSESAETENGTKDLNKASIEVHNGSAHSSVDNSSSGREDISPEDEVCLPAPNGVYDASDDGLITSAKDMREVTNIEDEQQDNIMKTENVDSVDRDQDNTDDVIEKQTVVATLSLGDESSVEEEAPLTPTVLSIPVPQTFFANITSQAQPEGSIPPVSPPHACLMLDTDLPEQDQQSAALPPPPPLPPLPYVPLPPRLLEDDYDVSCVPPPPVLLSDAPECDLPPPMSLVDLPPPSADLPPLAGFVPPPALDLEQQLIDQLSSHENGFGDEEDILPPPLPASEETHGAADVASEAAADGITVIINPMAEIDELASRVAKACRDDYSPITSPVAPPSIITTPAAAIDPDDEDLTKV